MIAPHRALLAAISVLCCTPAAAQEAVPVEVYAGPHPKVINRPQFPEGEYSNEGWVELAFMVDPSGKPFEVTVIRSTGNKTFEKVATQAIQHSSFEPGTLNGKPVEAGFEMKYIFSGNQPSSGARYEFVDAYKALTLAVKAGDRKAADAAMSKLKVTNLYEDAYFGLASYFYASQWGDVSQQLEGLNRAIAAENTAKYLSRDMFRFALLTCMQLELKTHRYGEAMMTWKRLEKSGVESRIANDMKPVLEDLQRLRSDDRPYDVSGVIPDGSWYLHLLKKHFRAVTSEGYLSEVRLRCDKHYLFFPFDSNLEYRISGKDGNCSIELTGAPGTRFTLTQF